MSDEHETYETLPFGERDAERGRPLDDLPRALRPREKLFARGPGVLSHGELLSLVLGVDGPALTVSRTAHRLMRGLGLDNVRALRMLDPVSGRWFAAEVRQGQLVGYDFAIPASAVLLVDMQQAVNDWRPE